MAVAGWVATAMGMWALCLPLAWLAVNGVHVLLTSAERFPAELGATAWSYGYGGVVPLVVTIPVLFYVARARRPWFRGSAVALCLVLGSWFGSYVVGIDEPVIQTVLVAWGCFGLIVPRPPTHATPG